MVDPFLLPLSSQWPSLWWIHTMVHSLVLCLLHDSEWDSLQVPCGPRHAHQFYMVRCGSLRLHYSRRRIWKYSLSQLSWLSQLHPRGRNLGCSRIATDWDALFAFPTFHLPNTRPDGPFGFLLLLSRALSQNGIQIHASDCDMAHPRSDLFAGTNVVPHAMLGPWQYLWDISLWEACVLASSRLGRTMDCGICDRDCGFSGDLYLEDWETTTSIETTTRTMERRVISMRTCIRLTFDMNDTFCVWYTVRKQ